MHHSSNEIPQHPHAFDEPTEEFDPRRGFVAHVAIYVLVNAGLFTINLRDSTDRLWFFWPILGWGVGLALHAVAVFAKPPERQARNHSAEGRKHRRSIEHRSPQS